MSSCIWFVWGENPNRYDSWASQDDVRMSMLLRPCKRSSEDLALYEETDVVPVHRMRCSRLHKGRKVFEYLVDELSTWITEGIQRSEMWRWLISSVPRDFAQPGAEVPSLRP